MTSAFESPVMRIRAAHYVDGDTRRNKRYRVHAPASAKLRRDVAAWANGRIPAELDAFLALTAGFEGAGTCVNIKRAWTGPTGVLAVHDYGNGDCLGLDDEGDRCAVWWIGHDPFGMIFVAETLLDYVMRFVDLAERGGFAQDELALIRPDNELEPVSAEDARRRRPDRALTDVADAAVVFDFREAGPRTHLDLARIPNGFRVSRVGRLVIAEPPKPPSPQAHVAREVDYLVELAFGLIMMEQFDDARDALTRALQLDPSSQAARDRMQMLEARLARNSHDA